MKDIIVRIATAADERFASIISAEMLASAIVRGSGISKRSPASIASKMKEGKAVIALTNNDEWVGYSYLEVWSNGEFVSNSGLIISPAHRGQGIANRVKNMVFKLSKKLYPAAKIFSITTGQAIMKMNARLGFEAVGFDAIARDQQFWEGCKSCVNYPGLLQNEFKSCKCIALRYTPPARAVEINVDNRDTDCRATNPITIDLEKTN